ncbi:hypothetical protein KR093_010876, partial [Drosophila rubida]
QQAKRMIFSNGRTTYNRDFFSNFTVSIFNETVDSDLILVKSLHAGLKGHLSFEYRSAISKAFQKVFQVDLDYCNVLKASKKSISGRWAVSMQKIGNYSTKCPIPPAYYYAHGWKSNGDLVPSFLALGDYRITGSLYYGKYRENGNNSILKCTVNVNLV